MSEQYIDAQTDENRGQSLRIFPTNPYTCLW